MTSKSSSWWQKIQQHPFVTMGIIVLLLAFLAFVLAVLRLGWDWTGFTGYSPPTPQYQRGKTLWDWLQLLGMLAVPVVVGFGAVWFTHVQQEHDQQQQQEREQQQQEREQQEKEARESSPNIQLGIDCRFYGPEKDYYLVEFLLSAHNRGHRRYKFKSIRLRVRGIEIDHPFSVWQGKEPRIEFPLILIDDEEIIPKNLNFLFIGPEVEQIITYVSRLRCSIKYILVHISFEYDLYTPHTVERVFQIKT